MAAPQIASLVAAAADRARACGEANLALRAGLNALEDARQKVRESLTGLGEEGAGKREGLREALSVIGHLVTLTQGQVPISDGQLMEARYSHASLAALATGNAGAADGAGVGSEQAT